MFNVIVEWLDEGKSRARFALPGRVEWSAQHVDELIRVLRAPLDSSGQGEARARLAFVQPLDDDVEHANKLLPIAAQRQSKCQALVVTGC